MSACEHGQFSVVDQIYSLKGDSVKAGPWTVDWTMDWTGLWTEQVLSLA